MEGCRNTRQEALRGISWSWARRMHRHRHRHRLRIYALEGSKKHERESHARRQNEQDAFHVVYYERKDAECPPFWRAGALSNRTASGK